MFTIILKLETRLYYVFIIITYKIIKAHVNKTIGRHLLSYLFQLPSINIIQTCVKSNYGNKHLPSSNKADFFDQKFPWNWLISGTRVPSQLLRNVRHCGRVMGLVYFKEKTYLHFLIFILNSRRNFSKCSNTSNCLNVKIRFHFPTWNKNKVRMFLSLL